MSLSLEISINNTSKSIINTFEVFCKKYEYRYFFTKKYRYFFLILISINGGWIDSYQKILRNLFNCFKLINFSFRNLIS